jgi:hypothetical protein
LQALKISTQHFEYKVQQTKLIQLLKSYSSREIKRFDNFLDSPYFNKNQQLLRFYRLLSVHHPKMESSKLAKEKVYVRLYGKLEYKDKTMRDLTSELFKLAKTFLIHEEVGKNDLEASVILQQWLTDHKLDKFQKSELDNRKILLDTYTQKDNRYYHHQWLYQLHKFEVTGTNLQDAEFKLLKDFDLLTPVHALNRSYLLQLFSMHHYILAISSIYNFPYDKTALRHIETLAMAYINKGDLLIDLYFLILKLAETQEENYYFELKKLVFSNTTALPTFELVQSCIALGNYCERKARDGWAQFTLEALQVFKFELAHSLYLEDGKMSCIYYHNVIIRGLEANEIDWVEDFIETYKDKLWDEYKLDYYDYARAHLLFVRKNFREALRLALATNLPILTRILARGLTCRAQYELEMFDELFVTLGNFPYLLKDGRLTDERRQHFQFFITLMRQLADLKITYNYEKTVKLLRQVEAQKGLMNRPWFLDKVNELLSARARKDCAVERSNI